MQYRSVRRSNVVVWWSGLGLWPCRVVRTLDVPFGHLAFDDAGIGACSSAWVESAQDPGEEHLPAVVVAY